MHAECGWNEAKMNSDAARVLPECSELNAGMQPGAARLQLECCQSAARTYIKTWIKKKN